MGCPPGRGESPLVSACDAQEEADALQGPGLSRAEPLLSPAGIPSLPRALGTSRFPT